MKEIIIDKEHSVKKLGNLFGLFFEDINHAADGGLYAEMIQNRSFEFSSVDRAEYTPLTAWSKSENLLWEVRDSEPLNSANSHYLYVKAEEGSFIENEGFNTGLYLVAFKKYLISFYAKGEGTVSLSVPGAVSEVDITIDSLEWKKYSLEVMSKHLTTEGRLRITFKTCGEYCFDMISMFPAESYMGIFRKDIADALKEMKPKFMRFPGGCLTHAGSLDINARDSMYRWIKTIGPVEERPSWRNNWGYNQSLGLGFYEYFLFCEFLECEPLPVVPAGFNPHSGEGAPLEEIDAWVEETLALIEFANGDKNTKMGGIRADMGHEEPFNLKYIGIGNEEIGEGFFERYPFFHKAIREKYPDIKIINTAGPFATGEGHRAGWNSAIKWGSDMVDEHYYSSPEWYLANMHHYDDYDDNGPHVFLGEYASWSNTFFSALVEAAYMTHLEKAPAVELACYAPMLCNKDYVNWTPDMLWYDNRDILKTANYYVQSIFMNYQGEEELAVTTHNLDGVIKLSDSDRLWGECSITGNDVEGRIYDIKLTKADGTVIDHEDFKISTDNLKNTVYTDINESEYTWEFSFKREKGRKGLKIAFGKNPEEETYILWEFGGWDNWDCNISSFVRGRASTISHRIFHVTDEEYRLKIEVKGRSIKTYVNGTLMNDTVDRLPEMEELYLSASKDSEDNIYIKAVNLQNEEVTVNISIPGARLKKAVGEVFTGELTAENTFDDMGTVVPQHFGRIASDDGFEYTFKPRSVTAMRLMQHK